MNVPVLQPDQLPNIDAWLRSILWDSELPVSDSRDNIHVGTTNVEIHRLKARLPLSNGNIKFVQGVRDVFEILDAPKPEDSAPVVSSQGKIILIGRKLEHLSFEESLNNAIYSEQ